MPSSSLVSMAEVAKHNTAEDCWLLIKDQVYNLSNFIHEHPGGVDIIAAWAGKDGTSAFSAIHSTDVLRMLEASDVIGTVDVSSIQPHHREANKKRSDAGGTKHEVQQVKDGMAAEGAQLSSASDPLVSSGGSFHPPPISNCLNIADLESVCVRRMAKEGLDYYTSAADDEITLRENRAAFLRVFLKPRVLVNVAKVDTATSMLGTAVSLPLYLSACALGRLAHPDGECALTRAAGSHGIIQMCPTLGSCSIEEMAAARSSPASPTQWFQLYVNANRDTTLSLIRRAEASGMQALCITVDAPVLGRRERDMRNKLATAPPSQLRKSGATQQGSAGGVARSLSQFIDPSLSWSDIAWFRQHTRLPLVLKGIQTAEDAVMAVKHGAAAIVVSNHGGRQLDCCRSGIEMLIDICDCLRAQQLWGRLEVYMDGGVRRGSDIYKALAAGARAVGIGRPALFGLGAYGQQGVERAVEILREELTMTMMLMGCPTLADVQRDSLMTNTVAQHLTTVPTDFLAAGNYRPLGLTAMSKL